jgi:hypothetical protein
MEGLQVMMSPGELNLLSILMKEEYFKEECIMDQELTTGEVVIKDHHMCLIQV